MPHHPLNEFPYWWEGVSHPTADISPEEKVWDVVIIGGGFTGLHAAMTLASSGQDTLVLEAGRIGQGASGRNGGMLGNLLIPGLGELVEKYGAAKAAALYREGEAAFKYTVNQIDAMGIECDLATPGRLFPAATSKHLEQQKKSVEMRHRLLGREEAVIDKAELVAELSSPLYHGAFAQFDTGSLHPGKYAAGLAKGAEKEGARIVQNCRADRIKRTLSGFEIETSKGWVRCRQLIMATNGYHEFLHPSFFHRIIPIASSMIATAEMDPSEVTRLIPSQKSMSDSYKILNYFRPSPDGKRLLIGGRPSILKTPLTKQADILLARLKSIFPTMPETSAEYVWTGNVAYGFNSLPHIGQTDGIYFASGYGGSGVAMSGYLGQKIALKMLEKDGADTAFDDLPFETRFYYNGQPWFLPLAMIGYKLKDKFGI